jgi:hypothetical protein
MTPIVALDWLTGAATLSTNAAMLLDAVFDLEGQDARPFARAPWLGDPPPGLPGHLAELAGEFVCVPFGSAALPAEASPHWAGLGASAPVPPHGPSADGEWMLTSSTPTTATFAMEYPAHGAVELIERTVAAASDGIGLDFSLTVHVREATRVPIGVHPILRLPERPGALVLSAQFAEGFTYPARVHGTSVTRPGRTFASLQEVPSEHGMLDVSRLPLDRPVEDVLQLCGVLGPVTADFTDEGFRLTLDWDREALPSLLIWLSDRALAEEPWNSRYRGLGLEPVASAFDLPPSVSASRNPISDRGHITAVALRPGEPWRFSSSVRIERLTSCPHDATRSTE